jgi:hypothetical protein
MMVVKMEQGWDRFRAATFAYTSTAPDADRHADHGHRLHAGRPSQNPRRRIHLLDLRRGDIALLVSWLVAVLFTPYLGFLVLDAEKLHRKAQQHGDDAYGSPFYRRVRATIEWSLRHRWLVIIATALAFAAVAGGACARRAEAVLPGLESAGAADRPVAAATAPR